MWLGSCKTASSVAASAEVARALRAGAAHAPARCQVARSHIRLAVKRLDRSKRSGDGSDFIGSLGGGGQRIWVMVEVRLRVQG